MLVNRPLLALFCLCAFGHAQSPSSADQVFSDPKAVHPPVAIRTAEAQMPDKARRQQLDGFCIVGLVVGENGLPQNTHIVRCTDSIFAENSLKAVKNYRFQPATSFQDNKPVLFRLSVEINFRFGRNREPIPFPQPRLKLSFLLPSQPVPSEPDSAGTYTLSHAFDPPNSLPRLERLVGAGFGRAAFSLDDGAGCIVALTIHENGLPSDAEITKCDDPALEAPAIRSVLRSQFSPAVLNGKPVPVRAAVHLVCEGFEPTSP